LVGYRKVVPVQRHKADPDQLVERHRVVPVQSVGHRKVEVVPRAEHRPERELAPGQRIQVLARIQVEPV
jgi:hypothetical protein